MTDVRGASRFEAAIAAAAVIVTAMLGVGQLRISQRQTAQAEDAIEVQVMSMVAPHLPKLRGCDKEAETSGKIVQAAADYLTARQKTGLAVIHSHIIDESDCQTVQAKARAAEATIPASEGAPWYAVLASLPATDTATAQRTANDKLNAARQAGLDQRVALYKTKVSNNLAVVIGGQMARPAALDLAQAARRRGLAADAFAQQDRSWTFVGEAPFK
jgi:hypothetical protein